jgi:glycerol-3-phosphate dehydrogenase
MRRDPAALAASPFDLLVVGAGIYGACAAWDAAQRGLSVALIDKGDFGGATSANSQKLIHGGLRYLQKAQLRRMRESVNERRAFLRIAPQLVRPLRCLVPAYGHGTRGRGALRAALLVNDLLSWDRNRAARGEPLEPALRIPPGRILSRAECLRLFPDLPTEGLTGGALFTDGVMRSSERLTLAFVLSAAGAGAQVANYVRATRLLISPRAGAVGRVAGAAARDELSGAELEIRARVVLDATGPWAAELAPPGARARASEELRYAKGFNVVVARELVREVALGVLAQPGDPVRSGGGPLSWRRRGTGRRFLFFTPWRGHTVMGTQYLPHHGPPEALHLGAHEVADFLESVNRAYPAAALGPGDVTLVQRGLLRLRAGKGAEIADDHRVQDSALRGGPEGLIGLTGAKYTTARAAAEEAVDRVCAKLGRAAACRTATTPLSGATLEPGGPATVGAREPAPPEGSGLPRAQILHAIRAEGAVKLADVVLRRTDLGAAGPPAEGALEAVAAVMATELGWDARRRSEEVEEVRRTYLLP